MIAYPINLYVFEDLKDGDTFGRLSIDDLREMRGLIDKVLEEQA
jgi:hypothetical protein